MDYQNVFEYKISVGAISLIAEPADGSKVVRRRNICSLTQAPAKMYVNIKDQMPNEQIRGYFLDI